MPSGISKTLQKIMLNQANKCPQCSSKEFVTQPNRYGVMTFSDENFEISDSRYTEDQEVYHCRECSKEVIFLCP